MEQIQEAFGSEEPSEVAIADWASDRSGPERPFGPMDRVGPGRRCFTEC